MGWKQHSIPLVFLPKPTTQSTPVQIQSAPGEHLPQLQNYQGRENKGKAKMPWQLRVQGDKMVKYPVASGTGEGQ